MSILKIFSAGKQAIKAHIIFIANSDKLTPPVSHLLTIKQKHGHKAVKIALDDWYMAPSKSIIQQFLEYREEVRIHVCIHSYASAATLEKMNKLFKASKFCGII